MKKLIPIFLLIFISVFARAANVTFTMTNAVTGLPDTNVIKIFAVRPFSGANGSYNTVGTPIVINPNTNGFYQITNMPAGMFIANNAFISGGWINGSYQAGNFIGPGEVGGPSGVMFWVDTTTNTYPFTTYPVSYGNGIYNVFNFVQGITAVNLINGFAGGVTNNVLYLDGAGFSAVITYHALTNALGYIPANTNILNFSLVFTNGLSAIGGQTLYWQTNYDGYGSWLIAQANSTNFTLAIAQALTNDVTQASNVNAQATANVQTALGLTNATIQLQITLTTNQLAALIVNEHAYATAISNLFILGSNNLNGFTLAVSNYNQTLTYTIGANGTNNLNASNTVYQLQFTTLGNNDTNQSFLTAKQATNTLANNFIAWATATFDPINSAQFATNLLGSAAWHTINFFATNIPASGGSTNLLGTRADGSEVAVPWSGLPSGGGSGSTSSNNFVGQLNFGQIFPAADTNGAGAQAFGAASNSITAATNLLLSVIAATNATDKAQLQAGTNSTLGALANTNSALVVMIMNASNIVSVQVLSLGTASTNWATQISNSIVLLNHYINSVTNGQSILNVNTFNYQAQIKDGNNNQLFDAGGDLFLNNEQSIFDSVNSAGTTGQFLGNNTGLPTWGNITIANVSGLTAAQNNQTNLTLRIGLEGTNNTTAVSNILQTAINLFGSNGTNNLNSSNALYVVEFTTLGNNVTNQTFQIFQSGTNYANALGTIISNAVVALTYPLANTNAPTIWSPTIHTVVNVGGNPYQQETNGVLGFTNWPSVNGFTALTFIKYSPTLWICTNNPLYSVSTNGPTCSLISNATTIATATSLNGTWTMQAPGSGSAGGVYIGSTINEIGVQHKGQAEFPDGMMAGSYQDSFGNTLTNVGQINNALTASQSTNAFALLPSFGHIYFVSPSGNTTTAKVNDSYHPWPAIFSDGTGTNFPNSGQAVDLATNGDEIYIEPSSNSIICVQLKPGVTLRGHSTNDTMLTPTNCPLQYAGVAFGSPYSLLQPGNYCHIEHLNLNAYSYTNTQIGGTSKGYLSWLCGCSPSNIWKHVTVEDCFLQGAWDTFYSDYSGQIDNRFSLTLIHNLIHSKWDIASLSQYIDVVGYDNTYYQDSTNFQDTSKITQGGFATWNEFGSRFIGLVQQVSVAMHGCEVLNSPINPVANVPNSQTSEYSEIALETNATIVANVNIAHVFSPDLPAWMPSSTNIVFAFNYNLSNLQATVTGDAAASGKFGLSNSLAVDPTSGYVVWTNGFGMGVSFRSLVFNDPNQTNDIGQGVIVEESQSDNLLYAWGVADLTGANIASANPGSVQDGSGSNPLVFFYKQHHHQRLSCLFSFRFCWCHCKQWRFFSRNTAIFSRLTNRSIFDN